MRYDAARGVANFDWVLSRPPSDPFQRGWLHWHRGDFGRAVEEMVRGIQEDGETEGRLFWLARAWMRLAEQRNCLSALAPAPAPGPGATGGPAAAHAGHHDPAAHAGICTLPLTFRHPDPAPGRRAAELLLRLLDEYAPGDPLYTWLYNFQQMPLGGFPHDVPERYRIRSRFMDLFTGEAGTAAAARHPELSLVERGAELGVATPDSGKGVAVEDFDGDGRLDIVEAGLYEKLNFYRNSGTGAFEERGAAAGFGPVRGNHIVTTADFDGDGCFDLLVSRPFAEDPPGTITLLKNRCDGRFDDVTRPMGLDMWRDEGRSASPWVHAWADVDMDGDLDLLTVQFGVVFWPGARPLFTRLWRNDITQFTDITEEFGLDRFVRGRLSVGAAFGDFDDDGDPDLFLGGLRRFGGILLVNDGGRRFVESDALRVEEPGFMASFLDVDHDGRLDLLVGGSCPARICTEQAVFGRNEDALRMGRTVIFRQREDRSFERRADLWEDAFPIGTMGLSYGDINNDGAWDFYLGTGSPEGAMILPKLFFLGRTEGRAAPGTAENLSMAWGLGSIQKGHGIVFFDFDGDGDQDIYSALRGMWPGDVWPNQMFVNESRLDAAWVDLRLLAPTRNRHGVGARIAVFARAADGGAIVRRFHVNGGTGFGSGPYVAHMGLMDAVRIERIEVLWPGESRPRVHAGVALRAAHVLRYEDGSY
jgi:hypothetical protein